MQQVKSKHNISTELKLIQFFKSNSITGWRRNYNLFGKPDFVFPSKKIAVFVDGCFWHGHNCRNLKPKSNTDYWINKILRNRNRDKLVTKTLTNEGWKVVRIWECQLSNKKKLDVFTNINKDLV